MDGVAFIAQKQRLFSVCYKYPTMPAQPDFSIDRNNLENRVPGMSFRPGFGMISEEMMQNVEQCSHMATIAFALRLPDVVDNHSANLPGTLFLAQ